MTYGNVHKMFLFNLDKIDRTMGGVLTQFTIYTAIGVILVIILQILFPSSRKKVDNDLWECVFAGPFEECIFRGLPMWILGVNGGIAGTIIWAILHGNILRFIYCIIVGTFYLRMWISGMWVEAIVLHSVWNIIVYALVKSGEKSPNEKQNEEKENATAIVIDGKIYER